MANVNFRINIPEIESILHYSFNNKDLLQEALGTSYHRLEFFGDAILEFVIAINIYRTCENADKKSLIRSVQKNVENGVLGRVALKHGFHNILLNKPLKDRCIKCFEDMLDRSESDENVKPPKVLANIIESLAGAVYVDSEFSYEKVWEVFRPLLNPLLIRETTQDEMEGQKSSCREHCTKGNISSINRSPSESLKSHKLMDFFGHLVLNQALTKYLYITYPDLQPGMLTTSSSDIMSNVKLARVAIVKLQVHKHLSFPDKSLGDKVMRLIEDINDNCEDVSPPLILCNIVKSITGAMFLDSSGVLLESNSYAMERVWQKFKILLEPLATVETFEKHPVEELDDLREKNAHCVEYKDHKFKISEEMIAVEVFIDDKMVRRGGNKNKKLAKSIAARSALEYLKAKSREKISSEKRLVSG
ncbi:hypothetical protein SUGI_0714370 [Cryptomeria japonica]|nr:hypothetical protein SUGI_0714370 [Cryptomeria japonica]